MKKIYITTLEGLKEYIIKTYDYFKFLNYIYVEEGYLQLIFTIKSGKKEQAYDFIGTIMKNINSENFKVYYGEDEIVVRYNYKNFPNKLLFDSVFYDSHHSTVYEHIKEYIYNAFWFIPYLNELKRTVEQWLITNDNEFDSKVILSEDNKMIYIQVENDALKNAYKEILENCIKDNGNIHLKLNKNYNYPTIEIVL